MSLRESVKYAWSIDGACEQTDFLGCNLPFIMNDLIFPIKNCLCRQVAYRTSGKSMKGI